MHKHLTPFFCLFLVIGINQSVFSQNEEDVFIGHTVPDDPNVMFYIQKNTNPNTVVYAMKLGADGKMNPEEPMEVFWRRYQEDGARKKLAWLEKTFAFDFKVKPVEGKKNTYAFNLIAMKDKKIYVTQTKTGEANVFMKIDGKMARLERIYVMVDDSKRIQSVDSMELFGRDYKTGKLIYEKIVKD
ncbi:DUF4833 domain-containing protein [Vicingaceae bacterium]|nr:DUF4833 domain-containing protein [Vicingaceae bacterium]